MIFPVIDLNSVRVHDGGDLPKGFYFYNLTKIGRDGNETYCHTIQVYAKYEGNIVSLYWEEDWSDQYRLYRGTSMDKYDGYFDVYTNEFHDDGTGVLNELGCQ
jgi:hypothetical protein